MSSSDYGSSGGPVILYGVTIQDAIKRGDQGELRKLLDHARKTHQDQGDLGQAIRDLEKALG